jgi:DNA-binding transcriptional MerR regulator
MTESTRRPSVRPKKIAKPAIAAGGFPERGLKIGEAATVLGVETYVLRFWETQFPFLKPKHSKTKHRFYHERDIEVLQLIKRILHDEGFTIAGANKYIKEVGLDTLLKGGAPAKAVRADDHAAKPAPLEGSTKRVLSEVRRDLENLHKLLED